MSTPNFALKNASRYFVVGMPVYYTQEDIDENELNQDLLGQFDEIDTEANYDADKENVAYELKAKGWHDIEECDGARSYYGRTDKRLWQEVEEQKKETA